MIQAVIYLAIFGMAASGLPTALGSDWHAFLEGELPIAPVLEGRRSRQVHGTLVLGLLLLVVGAHVAGVLVQQLRKGGTLRRMVPFLR